MNNEWVIGENKHSSNWMNMKTQHSKSYEIQWRKSYEEVVKFQVSALKKDQRNHKSQVNTQIMPLKVVAKERQT